VCQTSARRMEWNRKIVKRKKKTVLELDLWADKFLFFARWDLNSHHFYLRHIWLKPILPMLYKPFSLIAVKDITLFRFRLFLQFNCNYIVVTKIYSLNPYELCSLKSSRHFYIIFRYCLARSRPEYSLYCILQFSYSTP
jgi:hypothetical protein